MMENILIYTCIVFILAVIFYPKKKMEAKFKDTTLEYIGNRWIEVEK